MKNYKKYAVVKNTFDIHDSGALCVFDNTKQREKLSSNIELYKSKLDKKPVNYYICIGITSKEAYNLTKNYNIDIFDYRKNKINSNVYDWYVNKYGNNDYYAEYIPQNITFKDFIDNLNNLNNILDLFDYYDDFLRDRLCERIAQIYHCSLYTIIQLWENNKY